MTTYVATCRTETCLWHLVPAEFADYGERSEAVGRHRVTTGHSVDLTAVEHEEAKPLYLYSTGSDVILVCEREECMVTDDREADEPRKHFLPIELPWECTPAEAMRIAADHVREEH
jgi:hypothetical protein